MAANLKTANPTGGRFLPIRDATASYPGASVPTNPTISLVVPLFNEIDQLDAIINDLLAQTYPAIVSIWLVDGCSTDGTAEAIKSLPARDSRISVHSNKKRVQAAAINDMFFRESSDIVMRLDAHARYASDVVEQCVRTLLNTGAGGVGAVARPLPAQTPIGECIVAVHESRFGVGVARFRKAYEGCWTDTVWNGCYWRHVVEEIGPIREDLHRTEDNEFNARIREAGFGLYLDPKIRASYYPRRTLAELWKQYFQTGKGVMTTFFLERNVVSFRHLAPCGLVGSLLVLLVLGCIWPNALTAFLLIVGIYSSLIVGESMLIWSRKPRVRFWYLPIAFATLHLSYGIGSVYSMIEHFGTMVVGRREAK